MLVEVLGLGLSSRATSGEKVLRRPAAGSVWTQSHSVGRSEVRGVVVGSYMFTTRGTILLLHETELNLHHLGGELNVSIF